MLGSSEIATGLDKPAIVERATRHRVVQVVPVLLLAGTFLLYSQTWAFSWDESYHLLAAQLIAAGKTPYIDFCFPQTPLNAYWNAGWMSLLGQSWHVAHLFAALLTVVGVLTIADFVARRFPVAEWRLPAAGVTWLAAGSNARVLFNATVGQPYGMCLLALAVAFRFAVSAVAGAGLVRAGLAGLFAGTAAGASLLTAAATPVLLVWLFINNRAGSRWRKCLAFLSGAAVPFFPVFWLFVQAPQQTWFNVVQYHAIFRNLYWPGTTQHDLEVLTSWIDSGQAVTILVLAISGLWYVTRIFDWPKPVKAEFSLCAWLASGLGVEIALAHPTFPQYFLLTVPFLAILAAAGMYGIRSQLAEWGGVAAIWLFALVMVFGLGRALYDRQQYSTWSDYESIAAVVEQVTPTNAPVFAQEPIYFLTRRLPPPGHELSYSHKVYLPAPERARLHIITEDEMKQQVRSGMFATAVSCDDDEIAADGLSELYLKSTPVSDCFVFSGLRRPESH